MDRLPLDVQTLFRGRVHRVTQHGLIACEERVGQEIT